MRELTIGDFAPRRGKAIMVEVQGGAIPLVLKHVQPLPPSGRIGGSFRLEFHGPLQSFLPQATYSFVLGTERMGIFIVPLGPSAEAMRYEALFF